MKNRYNRIKTDKTYRINRKQGGHMEHKIKRSQEQHQWKEKIEELLKNMKYGNITIIVQDGKIIQIDKTEKHRI